MKRFTSGLSLVIVLVMCLSLFPMTALAAVEIPSGGLAIFNKDGIVITATKINRDKDGYVTDIDFTIANNNAEEKSIMTVPNIWSVVKINNLSFKAYLSSTVAAGKTAREKLRLDSDDVKLFGLKDVFEITMQFQTYVSENFMLKDIVVYDPSTIIISNGSYSDFKNGSLVFSNKDADIYSCGFVSGYTSNKAVFVAKNKTNKDIQFCFANLSTNGLMNSGYDESESLYKDTYRVFRISLDNDFDKDNVYEIEFTLKSEKFLDLISIEQDEISLVTVKYQQGSAIPIEKPSSWAEAQVNQAIAANLVPKSLQSSYTQATTRAEFCALAVTLYETIKGTTITDRKTFDDTTDINVEKAAAIGVVSGVGNNKFDPAAKLTREQAAVMLARLAEAVGKPLAQQAATFADNGKIATWAIVQVGQIQAAGIMSGVGNNTFAPQDPYTREQSIITINRLYGVLK